MRDPQHRKFGKGQRGAIMLGMMVALLAFAAFVAAFQQTLLTRTISRAEAERPRKLRAIAQTAESWYRQRLSDETNAAAWTASNIADSTGAAVHGAQVVVSGLLWVDGLPFHRILIYYPDSIAGATAPVFDSAGQLLNPPLRFHLIDGLTYQRQALSDTQQRLRTLAGYAEKWFAAARLRDPRTSYGRNLFRAGSCAAVRDDELPCVDTYTPLSSLSDVRNRLTVQPGLEINAWGLPILFSNGDGSVTAAPGPYTAAWQTLTPWAANIAVLSTEPE